ncbi:MAG: radical SAM protein [Candidatus Nanoarchaeia archaeon]|nr:radical SAM protein [Candidatus Nanoarchaeia archaeon]MDD5053860.1 radical SAM protein [Candidatus Nanoarchaeia archaeon]MDD5499664.1 radical SAM protein [Candidatus Nanoarchaeia archaeon]
MNTSLKEILNFKKIAQAKAKKNILLINPRRDNCDVYIPHMGLAMLASILKKRGHEVVVIDYVLTPNAPQVSYFLNKYRPDVVGISMITGTFYESIDIMKKIKLHYPKLPVIVGGPHASLYPEHLKKIKGIDYVVVGEAEYIIIDLVEKAKKNISAEIIYPKTIVDPKLLPYPDYTAFHNWKEINHYSIMTSRGCPFRCSFCAVCHVGQKKWRPRDPEDCIKELEYAKKILNKKFTVFVQDDNPLVIPERFYDFLRLFIKRINLPIHVINVRADSINEKYLNLIKKAGIDTVGIAVESANPEVFKMINKGESLETIEKAVGLIKKHKMSLNFCFIIGLPGDNLERVKDSINFVNKHKPEIVYLNMVIPFKKTDIRKWFEMNGTIFDEIGKSTGISRKSKIRCDVPPVETPDFTRWQREKAYYMFLFRTVHDVLKLRHVVEIFKIAAEYKEINNFLYWLPRGIMKSIKKKIMLLFRFFYFLKKWGLKQTLNRTVIFFKNRTKKN